MKGVIEEPGPTATWVEIDTGRISSNIRALRRPALKGARFLAVIKDNAYGHGDIAAARAAEAGGATDLGIALVSEGEGLRRAGVTLPILILSPTPPEDAARVVASNLSASVATLEAAEALGRAGRSGRPAHIHIKVDTGMTRSGVSIEEVPRFIERVSSIEGLALDGIFSHFASADEPDRTSAYDQFDRFVALLRELEGSGLRPPVAHIANSAAVIDMPETALDMVRCGISIYGMYPSRFVSRSVRLEPVLSWKARVMESRRVPAGTRVSYGGTYIVERETNLALLPVGYGHGYPRHLSNRGFVLLGGRIRPIAGRVTMDLIVVDCGDWEAPLGEEAVLVGRSGDEEIRADDLAEAAGTINYEITTRISPRVPRVYV